MIPKKIKRIPYGVADFEKIQCDNLYYVDKTSFIPLFESLSYYTFLIRPRRFGKSLWVSVLENYYDINTKDRFMEIFKNTWISQNPTEEKNSFLILTFNFSMINPDIRFIDDSFEANGKAVIRDFLERYSRYFTEKEQEEIYGLDNTADQLREILFQSFRKGLKIFLIIDEYDNFANTILSTSGMQAYHELTRGPGFCRYFFSIFKGGTSRKNAGLSRMFITGVSPITMDDVSSGFNIGRNISLERKVNEFLGFTQDDVREILEYYKNQELINLDTEFCFEIMKQWYNNYSFSIHAENRVFNPDMVLYFINQCIDENLLPDSMIDHNIRIDYGKLRHLVLVDRKLNGNFNKLKDIMETGQAMCNVQASFPLERLMEKENFISLLFYFGLLSFKGIKKGKALLCIPNYTVRKLMYGYLRDAFQDINIYRIDIGRFTELVTDMAYQGQWQPVFNFLSEQIRKQTSVRDYLEGEKVIQGFLLAYLNITDFFLTKTEQEMDKGFSDFWLEPFLAKFPDLPFAYLIELKYISRKKFNDSLLKEKINQAKKQLGKYAEDGRVKKFSKTVNVKKLVLIYNGWELVYSEEINNLLKNK